MKTILLEDFLDDGIIKEKSFREKISIIDFNDFNKEKVIIKGCAGVPVPTWAYLIKEIIILNISNAEEELDKIILKK